MKLNEIIFLIAIIAGQVFSQVNSQIDYNSGTEIVIDANADVCADGIVINGTFTGSGTICQGPLPVTISSFTFNTEKNNVALTWVTETEQNNAGFELQRKTITESEWKEIAFIQGSGTTNEQKIYHHADNKLKTGKYNYRLKQIDFNGNYEYFDLYSVVTVKAPSDYKISQNYPNPSNPKSKIDYEIPFDGKVSLKVYDLIGREVVTLVNEFKPADFYTAEFDGSWLASGVYFYRIIAESVNSGGNNEKYIKTLKMILVK